tara:strand:+ start:21091 stop:22743 length:1653 start_codon:yes stop_codon:yes gene_type:complete
MHQNKTLICTGFHRSATSATANYLLDAGLNMGSNLMLGNISNAKGHFEDWEAVLLHDEQLTNSGSNWQFHDECELNTKPDFLSKYIEQRNAFNANWGVKDPRACLFLTEWEEALGDSGNFLFVVRHWSSCIESLLHRHSRDFSYQLPKLTQESDNFKFWLDPALAAKMWLSYNKRLLAFAKKHPNKTILVSQRSLFEDAPLIETINSQFGFDLDTTIGSPFDGNLFRDVANEQIFHSLSVALQSQLNVVWAELLEIATFKSANEKPVIDKNESIYEERVNDILLKVQQECIHAPNANLIEQNNWYNQLISITDVKKMQTYIDSSSVEQVSDTNWLQYIDSQFSLNSSVLLSVAKLLKRMQQWQVALKYFQSAVTLGCYFPYIDMHIAQCYQAISSFDKAEFFFKKAIKANPNNPTFYTNFAKLLLVLAKEEDAARQFLLGYQKGSLHPACVLPYCQFLETKGRIKEALDIAQLFVEKTDLPMSHNLLNRLLLKTDTIVGKDYYHQLIKDKLEGKDLQKWLITSLTLIDNACAEKDFIHRCLKHWDYIELE